jgi:alkylation response protein AidB-like acyl-CoA dehydrogenase
VLFFDSIHLGHENLLGEVGQDFAYLMQRLPKERTSIAVGGISNAQAALDWTLDYVLDRTAFGQRVGDFQNTRFELAEMETAIDVTRAYSRKVQQPERP